MYKYIYRNIGEDSYNHVVTIVFKDLHDVYWKNMTQFPINEWSTIQAVINNIRPRAQVLPDI